MNNINSKSKSYNISISNYYMANINNISLSTIDWHIFFSITDNVDNKLNIYYKIIFDILNLENNTIF